MKTEEPLSATVEEYLEMIYNMNMEDEVVIGARLAEKFLVAPPTVTEMLKRLVRDGYVEMDNRRQVTLTEAGNQAANQPQPQSVGVGQTEPQALAARAGRVR